MASLIGKPGSECIEGTSMTDHKSISVKEVNHINYSLLDLKWLKDPKPDPSTFHLNQFLPDTVGLWNKHLKRPAADKNFVPGKAGIPEDKDSSSRTTAPSAVASDPGERAFFEAKPLVRTVDNNKTLDLNSQLIEQPSVPLTFLFFLLQSIRVGFL